MFAYHVTSFSIQIRIFVKTAQKVFLFKLMNARNVERIAVSVAKQNARHVKKTSKKILTTTKGAFREQTAKEIARRVN